MERKMFSYFVDFIIKVKTQQPVSGLTPILSSEVGCIYIYVYIYIYIHVNIKKDICLLACLFICLYYLITIKQEHSSVCMYPHITLVIIFIYMTLKLKVIIGCWQSN
ncbi:unnamed protein product [Meganyctiphanes norvegica]|uniref:Uncharacterized protein n=1 Tax=Meganyctiphanes norvegica TaxID=48144 RepID=A0AAV2SWS9_MEGNR